MVKARRLSTIALRILKIFGMVAAVILILFGIATWIIFEKKNDWVLNQIQTYMNESHSGQLEIGAIDFKLFRNFPDITLSFDSINYYEHRDSLRLPEEKPILQVDQLLVAMDLLPLLKDELTITEISLSDGQFHVVEYEHGMNLTLALAKPVRSKPKAVAKKVVPKHTPSAPRQEKKVKPKPAPPSTPKAKLQIDLQFISIQNLVVTWSAYHKPKPSVILVQELEADLLKNENGVALNLKSAYQVQSLSIKDITLPSGDLSFQAEVHYENNNQLITIMDSEIHYDVFSATLQGTYEHQKNQYLDLHLDASSNDLELLSAIIKPEVLQQNPDLLKRGDIYIKGRVFGELKNQSPQFNIGFGVKDLGLRLPGNQGTFENIGFEGSFSSGSASDYSQAKVEIKNLRGKLPGGFLKGNFALTNFTEPYVQYNLATQLKLDGYDQIFQITSVRQLGGSISFQANFDGPLKYFAQHRMDSSRSSSLMLDNLSFVVAKTNQPVTGLSGKIENKDNQTILQNLKFQYGKNDVLLNATIDNFVYFIFKGESDIHAVGKLQSSQLFTKDFILDTTSTADIKDRISNLSFNFDIQTSENPDKSKMPDITFDIRNLTATLDQLPNLKRIDTRGKLSKTDQGLKLDLHEFQAIMPYGKLEVNGDLLIREKHQWEFNAHVKANKFPWTYVEELVAEIKSGTEPKAKNLPENQMDILTADLDISAAIITYPFDFNALEIRNSRIHFSSPGSKTHSVEKLNVDLEELHFIHPENSGALTGIKSTKGMVELMQLKIPGLNPLNVNMNVTGENDTLDIRFSSATQKAKSEEGRLLMDISKKEIAYGLQYSVENASLEYFIKKFYKKKFMKGNIDYVLDLRAKGSGWAQVKQNLTGTIEITGDSLVLYGVNIDDVLRKYEKSQNFNLTDLGAVVIAGPVGLAVTKGTDFVSLAAINLDSSHRTRIKTLLTKWRLENQQLITEDVAFTTGMNRIAFNGRIDFATDSIPGLTIAVIDKNGCSLMDQKLYGKTSALKTGKLNITKTLFGSVINFVNAVVGKDCTPVYTGKVKAPQ